VLGWAAKRIGDPGWKLKCIDPPIAWLQLRRSDKITIGIRIQLTCFLSSRRADPVLVRETRLLLTIDGQEHAVPWTSVSDVGGGPFPEPVGHTVTGYEAEHALIDFATVAPEVVAALRQPGPPVPVVVEALVNESDIWRRVARFDLSHETALSMDGDWQLIGTGR
jgi:hypothetical protein